MKEALIQLKAGSERAFKRIFEENYSGLLRFAQSYIHDEFVAENIVQVAFLILWEKRKTLDDDSNIKAFLVTIIKNKAINYMEKIRFHHQVENTIYDISQRQIRVDIQSLHSLDPDELFTKEMEDLLDKAIAELPEQARKIFMMSRFEGFTNQQIADKLDLNIKTVEFHITKSLKFLKTKLSDYMYFIILFSGI